MRLIPDEDDREFASMLRRLLSSTADATRWAALAEAGVLGLALPECYGGAGATLADVGTFSIEAGRHLCPTIVHGTIHAGLVVAALGTDEQRATLLPHVSSGKLTATTALASPVDAGRVAPALDARRRGDVWTLHGAVDFLLDAEAADLVVVAGRDETSGGTRVFVVPGDSAGLRAEALTLMGGLGAARLDFDGVTADALGDEVPDDRLQRLVNTATVLSCLDLVGTSEAALQRTVAHTVMRQQFGRPIASFQAAQHLVANMHIAVAAARLAAWAALAALEEGHPARRQTAVARMHAATAAKSVTLDAHQLHGGIGYVVDTDLHLYSERARILSTLGGGADIAATWLEDEIT